MWVPTHGHPPYQIRRIELASLPLHPEWSFDGRSLIFSLNHQGAYDLFELDWPTLHTLRAKTRTTTGYLSPQSSPSGLFVQELGAFGQGITRFNWPLPPLFPSVSDLCDTSSSSSSTSSSVCLPLEQDPQFHQIGFFTPPSFSADAYTPTPSSLSMSHSKTLYSPQPSTPLLPPLYWVPLTDAQSTQSPAFGLAWSLFDLSDRHNLSGTLATSDVWPALDTSIIYQLSRFDPIISLGWTLNHFNQKRAQSNRDAFFSLPYRSHRLSLSGSHPFRWGGEASSLFASYSGAWTSPLNQFEFEFDPLDPPSSPPLSSFTSSLSFGLSWNQSQQSPFGLAEEEGGGGSIQTRITHPLLGSSFTRFETFINTRYSWRIHRHLVFGIKGLGFYGAGDQGKELRYRLNRVDLNQVLWPSLFGLSSPALFLRGFPSSHLKGSALTLLTLNLRMPFLSLFRGIESVPLFAKQSGFTLWSDLGCASATRQVQCDLFAPSTGVELDLHGTLFWRRAFAIRFGWGKGWGEGGIHHFYSLVGPRW